MSTRSDTATSI